MNKLIECMCDYCKKPRILSLTVVIYFFQSTGFEVIHKPEFKAWLHHVVTMNVWQVNFTSLNRLSFLLCKLRVIPNSQGCCVSEGENTGKVLNSPWDIAHGQQ